ncbi:hypothetical protein B0T13DRAFT_453776 [Neurospora crassa]|nr:hypothetical protein B0T13DRAFT_453776 [Neurospora crassa]
MSREIPASPSAELSTWTSVTLQWGRKQLKDEFLEVSSTSCRLRPLDRRRSGRQANLDGDDGNCPDEKAAGRQKLLQ